MQPGNLKRLPMDGLTVIVPTLNAAAHLTDCLAGVSEAGCTIVVDGGSSDATCDIARRAGATVVAARRGRGIQLALGAAHATTPWMLFLHADTVLEPGWHDEVATFISLPDNAIRAATFKFALDEQSPAARRLERLVAWRCRWLSLPYGDQGLLISRVLYDQIGGYKALPLLEDVDIIRRIGRHRLRMLESGATTSAARWRRDGWINRSVRNAACLALYGLGVPPRIIARLYAS
jgi:rSAM/selenodomain-associated transferase 2